MRLETGRFYYFGPFRLDPKERLLFRNGERVELTPKAFDMLLVLIESSGRLVTKEQLRQKLWPDTFVEESNLTFNIGAIRRALGDDRYNGNRLIETVPKRGYRFMAAVTENGPDAPLSSTESGTRVEPIRPTATYGRPLADPSTGTVDLPRQSLRRIAVSVAVASASICFAAALIVRANRPTAQPRLLDATEITTDGQAKDEDWLLTDGPRVYFGDHDERLMTESAGGGKAVDAGAPAGFQPSDISADDLSMIGVVRTDGIPSLWLWAFGGSARRLGNLRGIEPSWSPDGARIAYADGGALMVASADGSKAHAVAQFEAWVEDPRWSPEGKVLRFTVADPPTETSSLWEVGADGRNPHQLLPGWSNPTRECCGKWTADRRYYVFQSTRKARTDIWALPHTRSFLDPKPRPLPVTVGPKSYYSPTPGKDPSLLFAIGWETEPRLERYDLKRDRFLPYLENLGATQVDFSRDGNWLAYIQVSDHTLWRSRIDGSDRGQLSSPPIDARRPNWSPDGRQIAFMEVTSGKYYRIALVPSAGGEITHPLGGADGQGVPSWSPDGTRIVFGEPLGAHKPAEMELHVFDFRTGILSTLPGSQGLWTPRWSPDGRYIAALRVDLSTNSSEIRLFCVATQKWGSLVKMNRIDDDPVWSRDGKYLFFDTAGDPASALYRVRVPGGKPEIVTKLDSHVRVDALSGPTPGGSPLISHELLRTDVYALRVDWP